MKLFGKILIAVLILLISTSCDSGYKFEKGEWVWISYDEAVGRRVKKIDSVDNESFKVLDNENYAIDKNSVFYIGSKIKRADPKTFKILTENGYAIDKQNVFLDWNIVLFADPKTFQTIKFPYSKDKNDVYCGTIPLELTKKEVNEFVVTNDNSLSNMKSSILLSHFIEENPDYAWLDSLSIDGVIIGKWATGETKRKEIKGFRGITKQTKE